MNVLAARIPNPGGGPRARLKTGTQAPRKTRRRRATPASSPISPITNGRPRPARLKGTVPFWVRVAGPTPNFRWCSSGPPHTVVGMPTAIVTGASRGLGLALARALAERRWRLVVDAREPVALQAAAAELARHTDVAALTGDVADAEHRRALLAAAGGPVDLLVNNASLLGPSPQPPLADYPLDALERVYRVNVLAPLALIQQAAAPRTLNLSSDAAVEAYEGWGGYGSSK